MGKESVQLYYHRHLTKVVSADSEEVSLKTRNDCADMEKNNSSLGIWSGMNEVKVDGKE